MLSHKPENMVFFHRPISGEWMNNVVHLSEVGRPLNFDCTARSVSTVSLLPDHKPRLTIPRSHSPDHPGSVHELSVTFQVVSKYNIVLNTRLCRCQ